MRFIVTGCGRTGAGLARTLDTAGHQVAVIDSDETAFERLGSTFRGTTVHGVGFDRPVLERAGIEAVDGLAAVTGNDEVNAVVARLASRIFRVPKVVARLHDPLEAEIYRRLGVQVVAPVDWSIHRTADLLTFTQASVLVSLGSGQVDLVQAEAPALLAGRTVSEVTVPGEVLPGRDQPRRPDLPRHRRDDDRGRRSPPRGRRRCVAGKTRDPARVQVRRPGCRTS